MNSIDAFLSGYSIVLNEQQKAALARTSGETLLLAVPGSGKTTVIIYRLGYLMYQGVNPNSILTVTFSRAGAKDLKKRFKNVFKETKVMPIFSTIHSFSLSVIRRYERHYHTHAFDVTNDSAAILRKLYYQKYRTAISENDMAALQTAISLMKNKTASHKTIEETKVASMDFPALYYAYEQYKRDHRLMDYDDMLIYAYRLLKKYPDLLSDYRSRYQYINVDEVQDTSPVQFAIIYLLAGKDGNLFMVGDEDQSIYGFRGADPDEMLMFKKRYPKGNVLLMTQNYRSTKALVDAADSVIHQNTERYNKHMMTDNEPGEKANLVNVTGKNAVYRYVINAIENSEGQSAVLFRNNESALPLVDLFDRKGINYVFREHTPLFFTHFVVRDVLSFMRLAEDFSDVKIFSDIYYKMDLGISKDQMKKLARKTDGESVFDTLLRFTDFSEWQKDKITTRRRQFKRLKKMKPGRCIPYILDAMGYKEHLDFREKQGHRIDGLYQKLDILKVIAEGCLSCHDFVLRICELEEKITHQLPLKSHDRHITLSTVHGSKGLEFDNVFLIDCVEGIFPPTEATQDTTEAKKLLNEEIRLFYVGVTRAKSRLTFVCDDSHGAPEISRFIQSYMSDKAEFGPEEDSKKAFVKTKSIRRGNKENRQSRKKGIRKKRNKTIHHGLQPGMRVKHNQFGGGVVLGVEDEKGVIRFEDGTSRLLNLNYSMETGILRLIKKTP